MKNQYDYLNDAEIDLSIYENEYVSEEEVYRMSVSNHKNRGLKKKAAVIGIAAALAVGTGVAAAEGHIERIIRSFTTGHNMFVQVDPNAPHDLPKEVVGLLYDKSGNVITAATDDDFKNMYDKNGNLLTQEQIREIFDEALGDNADIRDEKDAETSEWNTIEEAQAVAKFDIKYPKYIPEGFSFNRAYTYKNDDGSISGYYMTLEYTNSEGKDINIMERLLNDETAFKMSTDSELKEMVINGRKTIIDDGRNADFETEDSVSVSIHTKGNVSEDELIKITESIK